LYFLDREDLTVQLLNPHYAGIKMLRNVGISSRSDRHTATSRKTWIHVGQEQMQI